MSIVKNPTVIAAPASNNNSVNLEVKWNAKSRRQKRQKKADNHDYEARKQQDVASRNDRKLRWKAAHKVKAQHGPTYDEHLKKIAADLAKAAKLHMHVAEEAAKGARAEIEADEAIVYVAVTYNQPVEQAVQVLGETPSSSGTFCVRSAHAPGVTPHRHLESKPSLKPMHLEVLSLSLSLSLSPSHEISLPIDLSISQILSLMFSKSASILLTTTHMICFDCLNRLIILLAEGAVFKLTSLVFEAASVNVTRGDDLRIVLDEDRVGLLRLEGSGLNNGSKSEGINSFRTGGKLETDTKVTGQLEFETALERAYLSGNETRPAPPGTLALPLS
jgi:hypothetical protein